MLNSKNNKVGLDWLTPVAGSIFGPLSQTHFLKVSARTRFQVLLYLMSKDITLCLWSGFIYPRISTFDRHNISLSLFRVQKEAFEIRFMDSDS